MTPEQRLRRDRKLKRWCHHIHRLVSQKAPDAVLGQAISAFYFAGLSVLGKNLLEDLNTRLIAMARQMAGLCQSCDQEVPPARSYPPLCDTCNGKELADAFTMMVDLEDLEGEDDAPL